MSKNTFFNFINRSRQFPLSTDRYGKNYFRIDLNIQKPDFFSDDQHKYQLYENHISVYETESKSIDVFSQYHYTAHLRDEAGSEYMLHVYFNHRDELARAPIFSMQNDQGGFDSIRSEQQHGFFNELALKSSQSIVTSLKDQWVDACKQLHIQYKRAEQEACVLSTDIQDNLVAYRTKLEEISGVLEELVPLERQDYYAQILQFIRNILVNLRAEHQLPLLTMPASNGSVDVLSDEVDVGEPGVFALPQAAPRKHCIDHEIDRLVESYQSILDGNSDECTDKLLSIRSVMFELMLQTDEKETFISPTASKKLYRLNIDLGNFGEKLMSRFIIQEDFEKAAQLTPFHHMLNQKHLNMAFQLGKPKLLAFLLQYGDYSIDFQPVTVKGKEYPSMIHCCFELSSKAHAMEEFFAVLLHHNASLLGKDAFGLPMVHSILTQEEHPLKDTLVVCKFNTMSSYHLVEFYKSLIENLQLYLEKNIESGLDSKRREDILSSLQFYVNELDAVKNSGSLLSSSSAESLKTKISSFSQKYSAELYGERLKRDPVVIAMRLALEKRGADYLKKLSSAKQRELFRRSNRFFQDFDGLFAQVLDMFKVLSFEELKSNLIQHFEQATSNLDNLESLIDVQATLNRVKSGSKCSRKRLNSLVSEEQKLVKAINDYAKQFDFSDTGHMVCSITDQEISDELGVNLDKFLQDIQGFFSGARGRNGAAAGDSQSSFDCEIFEESDCKPQ